MRLKIYAILISLLLFVTQLFAQRNLYEQIDLNEVEFELEDFGRMWTFDDIPFERFKEMYGFEPADEWLEHVQKSALQFGGGCSAAFVSADGLIMTNHHCGRGAFPSLQKEGEDMLKDGFYAESLEEERKVPGLYVDQLIFIQDVTNDVINAMNEGATDEEKVNLRRDKIDELQKNYSEETGLNCRVISLFNGGKYSLYGYKRYEDVRLVMAPDFQIAATGWDWDNFTYPRYELDFAFYRAYDENGNPVKSEHYFTWSEKGAEEGELIFTVGRPGGTDRLLSVSQLEYLRDVTYSQLLLLFNEVYKVYYKLMTEKKGNESILLNSVMGYGNARKSYAGRLMGLRDEYIMQKKRDFENKLIEQVKSNSELNAKYGSLWESISNLIEEKKTYSNKLALRFISPRFGPDHLGIAASLIKLAEQKKLDEDERDAEYKNDKIDSTIAAIFPEEFDVEKNTLLTKAIVNYLIGILGKDDEFINKYFPGATSEQKAESALSKSITASKEKVIAAANLDPEKILNSDDPFIRLLIKSREESEEVSPKVKEIDNTLAVLNQQLGEIIFAVYGDKFPPEATSTLRISDGIIEGYEYNGTISPGKTTYFGLWDRYNSFDGSTYPWGLHERWKIPPAELDLSIPICFASTNDIVGGNSGSSLINTKGEVVGLAHDGNLESLPGHIIFLPENNRTVSTDSWGLMESLIHVYKTDRLVKELKTGTID